MKRALSFILAIFCMTSIMAVPASAVEKAAESVDVSALGLSKSTQELVENTQREYATLKEEGLLLTSDDGVMTLSDVSSASTFLRETMDAYNSLLEIGLVKYNNGSYSCDLNELAEDGDFVITEEMGLDFSGLVGAQQGGSISPMAEICGCNNPQLGLGSMVSRNTNDVRGVYLSAAVYNPSGAMASAIGYWVGKVQEGGDWDYKSKPNYAPYDRVFCCDYGKNNSKKFVHLTSEYIGNYNYGYTGSILFNLSVLKLGSFAAAGFDADKDAGDQPAIEEGYYDAKDCGEYLDGKY